MIQSNQTQAMNYYYFSPQNHPSSSFPAYFDVSQNNLPSHDHFNTFLTNLSNYQTHLPIQELGNNSTSDEAEDTQMYNIIDDRKRRRMISNRESARRSRMRKQRQMDELWSQAGRLRNENCNLNDKLNVMLESHEKVLEENLRLKEEASELRQMLKDLKPEDSYSIFRDLDEIKFDMEHFSDECSEQSFNSSTELLIIERQRE